MPIDTAEMNVALIAEGAACGSVAPLASEPFIDSIIQVRRKAPVVFKETRRENSCLPSKDGLSAGRSCTRVKNHKIRQEEWKG